MPERRMAASPALRVVREAAVRTGPRLERLSLGEVALLTSPRTRWRTDAAREASISTPIRFAPLAELKQSGGRDLLIQGSSTLYPPLLSAGLIDQLMLMTFPLVLGQGKSIFDGSQKAGTLKLVDHFVSNAGVVMATYEPAGDVRTGTFESKPPSETELERRERMRAGSW